jgi:hypothetical protein
VRASVPLKAPHCKHGSAPYHARPLACRLTWGSRVAEARSGTLLAIGSLDGGHKRLLIEVLAITSVILIADLPAAKFLAEPKALHGLRRGS